MRTNKLEEFLCSAMKYFGKSSREYTVEGSVRVVLNESVSEMSVAIVRHAILQADNQSEWTDRHETGEEFNSSMILIEGPTGTHHWGPGCEEDYCWFEISPLCPRLRKSQVHAYEKYLKTLCETVYAMNLPEVKAVEAIIKTSKVAVVCM